MLKIHTKQDSIKSLSKIVSKILVIKRESIGFKYLNVSKAFNEYWNNADGIYKTIEEYHPNKKRKTLIVFDDMTADVGNSKNHDKNSNWFIFLLE